jgi:hypothetical protein
MIVNNELERMWKAEVVTLFRVLSQYLPGWIDGDHKNPQSL